jgi:hypothetical protein
MIKVINAVVDLVDVVLGDSLASLSSGKNLLTGTLTIHVGNSVGLGGGARKRSEYILVIKIDGMIRATTKPARGGKWNDDFVIQCERASDCEITAQEKGGGVLAVVWFHLWELEEALEVRKSVVSAGPASAPMPETIDGGEGKYGIEEVRSSDFPGVVNGAGCLESVFEMEPVGRVVLGFNFGIMLIH